MKSTIGGRILRMAKVESSRRRVVIVIIRRIYCKVLFFLTLSRFRHNVVLLSFTRFGSDTLPLETHRRQVRESLTGIDTKLI